jgi:hypothetical protein
MTRIGRASVSRARRGTGLANVEINPPWQKKTSLSTEPLTCNVCVRAQSFPSRSPRPRAKEPMSAAQCPRRSRWQPCLRATSLWDGTFPKTPHSDTCRWGETERPRDREEGKYEYTHGAFGDESKKSEEGKHCWSDKSRAVLYSMWMRWGQQSQRELGRLTCARARARVCVIGLPSSSLSRTGSARVRSPRRTLRHRDTSTYSLPVRFKNPPPPNPNPFIFPERKTDEIYEYISFADLCYLFIALPLVMSLSVSYLPLFFPNQGAGLARGSSTEAPPPVPS